MATSEKPEFVLFLSNECNFCRNFLNKLKPTDLIKKFNIVDIDAMQVIPDEIDEIPCIYDGKTIFKGKDAFTWLNERLSETLAAANDGLLYSFLDSEEKVFNNYSLLEQKNGSFGIGDSPLQNPSNLGDPTRMTVMNDNSNKNRTLDSLMASRSSDLTDFNKK